MSTLYQGPIFETKTPPINDPIAMPREPIVVTIVIILIKAFEPSASHPSYLSRMNPT